MRLAVGGPPLLPAPLLLAVALATLLASCATPKEEHLWYKGLLMADRAFDHADYAEAKRGYEALRPEAIPTLDRYIALRLALIDAYTGHVDRALDALDALEAAPNPEQDEWASQARFYRAVLLEDLRGDPAAAAEVYTDLITRYPDSAAAQHALGLMATRIDHESGPAATIAYLAALTPALAGSTLADNLLWEQARRFRDDLGDPVTAERLVEALVADHPDSPLCDDALFALAELAAADGRDERALKIFDAIAEEHDESWSFGEYDSQLRNDAMLRRVDLFLARGEPQRAIAEYERILRVFPTYFGAARIAWDRAEVFRGPLHDADRYRAALEDLVDDYPDSVWAEQAAHRLKLLDAGTSLDALADAHMPRDKTWQRPKGATP